MWIIAALVSYLIWAFVNIGDRYLATQKIKSAFSYMLLQGIGSSIVALLIIPFIDFAVPNTSEQWLLFIGIGILWFYAATWYAVALQKEDVSRVMIWFNLVPVVSLLVAWSFIGEQLNSNEIIGFIIIMAATFVVSGKRNGVLRLSKPVLFAGLSVIAYGVVFVLLRYATFSSSALSVFIWMTWFGTLTGIVSLVRPAYRRALQEDRAVLNKNITLTLFGVSVADAVANAFNIFALMLAPVALVTVLAGSQSLFVLIIAIIVHWINPALLNEELDRKNIILKSIATLLVIIGIIVLNL